MQVHQVANSATMHRGQWIKGIQFLLQHTAFPCPFLSKP